MISAFIVQYNQKQNAPSVALTSGVGIRSR